MELRRCGLDCVAWNVPLPHPRRTCLSPTFSLGGTSDQRLLVECFLKQNRHDRYTETWRVSYLAEHPGRYLVVPYVQRNGLAYKRLADTLEDYEFDRRTLAENFGIHGDNVDMLFLFLPETLSLFSEEKSTNKWKPFDSDCGRILAQSLECLSQDMVKLLDNKEHPDVILKCGDRRFAVHKNILATRSEVFAAMLQHDMEESNTGVVYIVDLDSSVLAQFVEYLYSGKVEGMTVDQAVLLYQAADKYAVRCLKQFCAAFMSENLTKEIVCDILALAHQVGDSKLLETAISFAAATEGLLKTEEWESFATEYPSIATKVFLKYFHKL